jgi:hypothetical protein
MKMAFLIGHEAPDRSRRPVTASVTGDRCVPDFWQSITAAKSLRYRGEGALARPFLIPSKERYKVKKERERGEIRVVCKCIEVSERIGHGSRSYTTDGVVLSTKKEIGK